MPRRGKIAFDDDGNVWMHFFGVWMMFDRELNPPPAQKEQKDG